MKQWLFLFVFVTNVFNVYAQNNIDASKKMNVMELILFLNANQSNNGYADIKTDYEKKTLQYFDKEGRMIEESYIDENNDIVSREFDKDGKVVFENKITEASVMAQQKQLQKDHEEKVVPEIISKLSVMARAAESYAKNYQGQFPKTMKELIETNILDAADCTCDSRTPEYQVICNLNESGYTFKANAMWPHLESYAVSPGEKLDVIKAGKVIFEKSSSTCK